MPIEMEIFPKKKVNKFEEILITNSKRRETKMNFYF